MNEFLPTLENKNFLLKFGTLIVLIGFFFVITNILGILIAIPFFGLEVFLNYGKGFDFTNPDSLAFLKYLQVVSQIGVFVLPGLFYAFLYNRQPLAYLKLKSQIPVFPFFISILLTLASVPFVNFLVGLNEQMSMPEFMGGIERWMRNLENQAALMTEAFLKVNSPAGLVVNLLIIALLAALGEEILFRGVILKMLNESLKNIHGAVILSALIFSAFHGQFYGFVPRAVLGVMFGYIFVFTGSLWIPILLHMLFNSVSVVVAYLYETGRMTTSYEDFGNPSTPWTILLSFFFVIALMGVLYQKQKREQP